METKVPEPAAVPEKAVHAEPAPAGGAPSPSDVATAAAAVATAAAVAAPRTPSSSGGGALRFQPGWVVAGRYRIVSPLGAGGMGEVYRAEDLRLRQAVALKFLPEHLAGDPARLEMLLLEVRMGRQVSHPNVCRLHDVGDVEGHTFLSMEYVEGEDLARLLKRIGRLPTEKALEVARGICAGLAAAHAKGVLHRDLKPANIMIDGHGEPRLTDFGLAVPVESSGEAERAGTLAYAAPEQLDGAPASLRTDLYSLGLVLYELITGRRPHEARTAQELRVARRTLPEPPSRWARDLPPSADEIVLRCLAPEAAGRPGSAREVLAAFPSTDPLEAAVAAGKTPSPRSVAAAPKVGTLRPAAAAALLLIVVAGGAASLAQSSRVHFADLRPRLPFAVLEDRARTLSAALGLADGAKSSGLSFDRSYPAWLDEHVPAKDRLGRLSRGPATVHFWARRDPAPVTPPGLALAPGRLEPPPWDPGASSLALDLDGKLVGLVAVPDAKTPPRTADWEGWTRAAGLELATLAPAEPGAQPPRVPHDERRAFVGRHPGEPDLEVRVEAAAYRGQLVFFALGGSWERTSPDRLPFSSRILVMFLGGVVLAVLLAAIGLAYRNVRAGRGDARGAGWVAAAVGGASAAAALLGGVHAPSFAFELDLGYRSLAAALFSGASVGVLYLAVEPHLRRRWPQLLVSWARLVEGDVRDPLVGRDVLAGVAFGAVHAALAYTTNVVIGNGTICDLLPLTGLVGTASALGSAASMAVYQGLGSAVLLTLGLVLFRVRAGALGALCAVFLVFFVLALGPAVGAGFGLVFVSVYAFLVARGGLLAVVAAALAFRLLFTFPLGFQGGAAHAPLTVVAILGSLAIFAFRAAVGRAR